MHRANFLSAPIAALVALSAIGCEHPADNGPPMAPATTTTPSATNRRAMAVDAALQLPESAWVEPVTDPTEPIHFTPRIVALEDDSRIAARVDQIVAAHEPARRLARRCALGRQSRLERLRSAYGAGQPPPVVDADEDRDCEPLDRQTLGDAYPVQAPPGQLAAARARDAEVQARGEAAALANAEQQQQREEERRRAAEAQARRDAFASQWDHSLLANGKGGRVEVSADGTAIHFAMSYGCDRQFVYDMAHDARFRQTTLALGFERVTCSDPAYAFWWSLVDPQ